MHTCLKARLAETVEISQRLSFCVCQEQEAGRCPVATPLVSPSATTVCWNLIATCYYKSLNHNTMGETCWREGRSLKYLVYSFCNSAGLSAEGKQFTRLSGLCTSHQILFLASNAGGWVRNVARMGQKKNDYIVYFNTSTVNFFIIL